MSETAPSKVTFIDEMMHALWVKQDLSTIERCFHPDAKFHGRIRDTALTRNEFREWVLQFQAQARILSLERCFTADGNDGCIGSVIKARLRAATTRRTGTLLGMFFERIEDGLIVESYANPDLLNYFESLGMLPDGAGLLMLGGTRLA